jgi:diguanylate cyclase (GGDEF)-like protein
VVVGRGVLDVPAVRSVLGETRDVHVLSDTENRTGSGVRESIMALRPDLIVLGVDEAGVSRVAGQDVGQVCAALRGHDNLGSVPILVVVPDAHADGDEAAPAPVRDPADWLEHGASDVIPAGIEPRMLRARIELLLELRMLRNEVAHAVGIERRLGVASRRVFDSVLRRESGRLRRTDGHLGLLLIDIDFFKAYQHRYGGAAAEDCFQRIALCLVEHLRRPSDLAARMSAERLACLLPETDLRGVRVVGETIRDAVASLRLPHGESVVAEHVTVSIGAASRRCSGPEVESWLVSEARDRAQRARRLGCNCVVSGDGATPVIPGLGDLIGGWTRSGVKADPDRMVSRTRSI